MSPRHTYMFHGRYVDIFVPGIDPAARSVRSQSLKPQQYYNTIFKHMPNFTMTFHIIIITAEYKYPNRHNCCLLAEKRFSNRRMFVIAQELPFKTPKR